MAKKGRKRGSRGTPVRKQGWSSQRNKSKWKNTYCRTDAFAVRPGGAVVPLCGSNKVHGRTRPKRGTKSKLGI